MDNKVNVAKATRREPNQKKELTPSKATLLLGLILAQALELLFKVGVMAVGNGVVVMYLWNWLVAPVFSQLPMLGLFDAIGLSFIIGYMAKLNVKSVVDEAFEDEGVEPGIVTRGIVTVAILSVILFTGWVIAYLGAFWG